MIDGRATASLVPPSISDERGKAFGKTMARAIADPDFKKLLFERIDEVDASVLPFLVREFGLHKFADPNMPEAVIRRLLAGAYDLHKSMGFITGVKFGLGLLGIKIERWEQWTQSIPKRDRGTHRVYVQRGQIFPDEPGLGPRSYRAIDRMITGAQRASQEIDCVISEHGHAKEHLQGVHTGILLSPIKTRISVVRNLSFARPSGAFALGHSDAPSHISMSFKVPRKASVVAFGYLIGA
jgi:P2-related tail formation protein